MFKPPSDSSRKAGETELGMPDLPSYMRNPGPYVLAQQTPSRKELMDAIGDQSSKEDFLSVLNSALTSTQSFVGMFATAGIDDIKKEAKTLLSNIKKIKPYLQAAQLSPAECMEDFAALKVGVDDLYRGFSEKFKNELRRRGINFLELSEKVDGVMAFDALSFLWPYKAKCTACLEKLNEVSRAYAPALVDNPKTPKPHCRTWFTRRLVNFDIYILIRLNHAAGEVHLRSRRIRKVHPP